MPAGNFGHTGTFRKEDWEDFEFCLICSNIPWILTLHFTNSSWIGSDYATTKQLVILQHFSSSPTHQLNTNKAPRSEDNKPRPDTLQSSQLVLGIFRRQMNHPSSLLNSKTMDLLEADGSSLYTNTPCHSNSQPFTRTRHEIMDPCMAEYTSAAQNYPSLDWTELCSATEHTAYRLDQARLHKMFTWATGSYQNYPRTPLHNVTEHSTFPQGRAVVGTWLLVVQRRHLPQLSSTAM